MLSYKTKVSVLIPVYNAEQYIVRCIDSILNQTYPDLEVVLVNDGSTDNSGKICDEYASQDSRVRVFHKKNSGVSETRNVALDNAQGNYILFVDSDDYIEPNMVEVLVDNIKKNDCDIAMCGYYIQNGNNEVQANMKYKTIYQTNEEVVKGLIKRFYTGDNTGLNVLWNKLIRRDLYLKHKIRFNSNLKRAEDMWFVFDCLKCTERVRFINEPCYHYVQNPCSVMHQVYPDQYQQWKYTRLHLLEENKQFRFNIELATFYSLFLTNVTVHIKKLFRESKEKEAIAILKDDFLHEVAGYAGEMNIKAHIKLLAYLLQNNNYYLIIVLYSLWNKLQR